MRIGKNPFYDLDAIPSPVMRKELERFIYHRSTQVGIVRMHNDIAYFKKLSRFLQIYGKKVNSLLDKRLEVWLRQWKGWMLQQGIPLQVKRVRWDSPESYLKAREIAYLEQILKYLAPDDKRPEQEKDVWNLEKMNIPIRYNPITQCKSIRFTKIPQPEMREETKKGIFINLQTEAIACVQKEMTAVRRFTQYLGERHPEIQSFRDLDRGQWEEYLIYLKTESAGTKHFHADLNRLRSVIDQIGKVYAYPNLENLFLARDIPPTHRTALKTYSDAELKRLNAALVKLDEQIARLMIIHQMLGTRISDTLTLEPNCLCEKDGIPIIRIRQMKTKSYEKPVSEEVAILLRRAIEYTKERYGDTPYIFVNENNPKLPMQYGMIRSRVVTLLRKENVLDDHGEPFGFGTHMYRHTYGMKLTEMHLDDWTISKLLGHSNTRNVKYYRRMSDQKLAEETRLIRQLQSKIILENLDGWEEEYVQIRENGSLK